MEMAELVLSVVCLWGGRGKEGEGKRGEEGQRQPERLLKGTEKQVRGTSKLSNEKIGQRLPYLCKFKSYWKPKKSVCAKLQGPGRTTATR